VFAGVNIKALKRFSLRVLKIWVSVVSVTRLVGDDQHVGNMNTEFDKNQVTMKVLDYQTTKKMIVENHYSGRMPCCELSLGFYIGGILNCVVVFGSSATAKMANSLPSPNYWELVRLFSFDWSGKNTESYCIGKALKYVEQKYNKDVIISFADPSEGHVGYIYQASNWLYCGRSSQTGGYTYYLDGKWQHPRSTVAKFGTRKHTEILKLFPDVKFKRIPRKHRYIYLLGSKRRRKQLLKNLKYEVLPYPKLEKHTENDAGEVSRATRHTTSGEGAVQSRPPALKQGGNSVGINYKTVLGKAGWPTNIVTLDFETYWDDGYSLSKQEWPTVRYVNSDKFEATGLGIRAEDRTGFYSPDLIKKALKVLQEKYGKNLENCVVVMQNAFFDALILEHHYNLTPKYILDTKQIASFLEARKSHHLKDMAEEYGLRPKGDTKQFKGLHWNDMTEEQWKALSEYCRNDVDLTAKLFRRMLPLVTNPELELPLMNHTTQLFLQKNFKFDFMLAMKLKREMEKQADKIVKELGHTQKIISGNKTFFVLMQEALPPGERVPMKQGKKKMIPAFAKDDEGMKALLDHSDIKVRKLAEARQAVKSWPLHIKRVHNMIRQAEASDGYFRIPLKYAGAHTIRWSGCEGVNAQNFGSKADPLINQVRNLLLADEGKILVTGDSGAIEARGLAWIAGQTDLVEAFEQGRDVYSEFASMLLGRLIRKPKSYDPKPVAKILKAGRNYGKAYILGSGYGMGAVRMLVEMRKTPAFAEKIEQGKIDISTCKRDIGFYRQTYSMIPKFWSNVEKAFRVVTKYSDQVRTVGPLVFYSKNSMVFLRLPSGRELRYPHCAIRRGDNTIRWKYGHLWGGSITENIVQSMCRDLLGFWILECEKAGLPIVIHVHDDITTMVPKEDEEGAQMTLENIMLSKPAWAEGLPLAVESHTGERYEK